MPPKRRPQELAVAVVAAGVVGLVGLSYAAYRYFFTRRIMAVDDVITALSELHRVFAEEQANMEELKQELVDQAVGATKKRVYYLEKTMHESFQQRLAKREMEVAAAGGFTPDQLEESTRAHRDNETVQYLVEALQEFYKRPKAHGSGGKGDAAGMRLDLETTIKVMSTLLELSIVVMEEVHKQIAAQLDPNAAAEGRKPKLTQQFVAAINRTYAEQFMKVRAQVMERMGVNEQIINAASQQHQHEPQFQQLVANHKKEQQRRFLALGLNQNSPAG
jgi:hypothetical protein